MSIPLPEAKLYVPPVRPEAASRRRLIERLKAGLHRLAEEVLKRQPLDTKSFLLQTSILDRLTGPLCDVKRFGEAKLPSSSRGTAICFDELPLSKLPDQSRWSSQRQKGDVVRGDDNHSRSQ